MDMHDLTGLLIAGRNADGGWGYYRHKKSRLEPTCWAVLALTATGNDRAAAGEALRQWPARDGLLLERAGGEPNYGFQGLALLALHAAAIEHRDGNRALLDGLQRVKGLAFEPSPINRQDNSIQGWSWIDDTFSWVEPTAWCLLALKRCAQPSPSRIDPVRIRDAERLLVDRSCRGGGWNYGNSNMLGKELAPYVPTTAVALLALRDRGSEPVRGRGAGVPRAAFDVRTLRDGAGTGIARAPCLRARHGGRPGRASGAIADHRGPRQPCGRRRRTVCIDGPR